MHAEPARTESRWSRPAAVAPTDPAGCALVTVLARRLRGMSTDLSARAAALDGGRDPDGLRRLAELHEAIRRLDRYCDTLLALAGIPFGRPRTEPVDLLELLDAAASSVERSTRIELGVVDGGVAVSGWVAAHARHAVAELLDNATFFSPPDSPVTLDAWLVDAGLLVRVVDRGVGIGPARLGELNALLSAPPDLCPDLLRASGLPVVAVLAGWGGWTVRLDSRPGGGTVAELVLPHTALAESAEPGRARAGPAPADPVHPVAGRGPHAARADRPAGDDTRRSPTPAQWGAPVDRPAPARRGLSADRAVPVPPVPALPRRQRTATTAVPAGRAPNGSPGDPVATAASLAAYQRAWPSAPGPDGAPARPPWAATVPPLRSARGGTDRVTADRAQGTTHSDRGGC